MPLDLLSRIFSAVAGEEISRQEIFEAGERICLLSRAFNTREGYTREHDTLPDRFLKEPTVDEPKGLTVPLYHPSMLDEYYAWRGCDNYGLLTETRLSETGLEDVSRMLSKSGKVSKDQPKIMLGDILEKVTDMNLKAAEDEEESKEQGSGSLFQS